jgi:hypothetical protein
MPSVFIARWASNVAIATARKSGFFGANRFIGPRKRGFGGGELLCHRFANRGREQRRPARPAVHVHAGDLAGCDDLARLGIAPPQPSTAPASILASLIR